MVKISALYQSIIDLERKYGDGHHSFELREGIHELVMAARADERRICSEEVDALKHKFRFNSELAMAMQDAGIAVALGTSEHFRGER